MPATDPLAIDPDQGITTPEIGITEAQALLGPVHQTNMTLCRMVTLGNGSGELAEGKSRNLSYHDPCQYS